MSHGVENWYRRWMATKDICIYKGHHLPRLRAERWLPLPPQLANVADPRVDVVNEVDYRARVAELRDHIDRDLWHREGYVLRARYGIGQPEQTLEEVGDYLGLTRERIRQIQNSAEKRLRVIYGVAE